MKKLVHLRDDCIGCNSCVEHSPAFWFIDSDGKARLFEEENKLAAQDCPVDIIKIEG